MGLFNIGKKKEVVIFAPFDCEVIDIEKINDPVFSEKSLGDGIAMIPKETVDKIYSPVSGEVVRIFKTKHAVSLTSKDLQLFIHFGLETVALKGNGFEALVEKGQKVSNQDVLLKIDLPYIKEHAKSLETPIVISNMEIVKSIKKEFGEKKAFEPIAIVTLK